MNRSPTLHAHFYLGEYLVNLSSTETCLMGTATSVFSEVFSPSDTIRVVPNMLVPCGLTVTAISLSKFSTSAATTGFTAQFLHILFPWQQEYMLLLKRLNIIIQTSSFMKFPYFRQALWNFYDQSSFSQEVGVKARSWRIPTTVWECTSYNT